MPYVIILFIFILLTILINLLLSGGSKSSKRIKTVVKQLDNDKPNQEKKPLLGSLFSYKEMVMASNELVNAKTRIEPYHYLVKSKITMPLLGTFMGGLIGLYFFKSIGAIVVLGIGFSFFVQRSYHNTLFEKGDRKRIRKIEENIPDFFDLLSTIMESGVALNQAISIVCTELQGPLVEEFEIFLKDLQLGMSVRDSFVRMRNRVPSTMLQEIISSLLQASEMGVGISKTLKTQNEFIRKMRYEKMKEKAMTAQLKMLFPLMAFIFPVMFIIIFTPIVLMYI